MALSFDALRVAARPGSRGEWAVLGIAGAAGVAVLGPLTVGRSVWQEAQWEATRDAGVAVRRVIELAPGLYPAFELTVRLLAGGWPVWLVLETLVALGLAWRGHAGVGPHAARRAGLNLFPSH